MRGPVSKVPVLLCGSPSDVSRVEAQLRLGLKDEHVPSFKMSVFSIGKVCYPTDKAVCFFFITFTGGDVSLHGVGNFIHFKEIFQIPGTIF